MNTHTARWVGVLVALLALPALGWAQEAEVGDTEAPKPAPTAASARKDANLVRANGKAALLLWASGVTDEKDLEAYAAAGFNTLAVPITGGSKEDRDKAFALASAAEEQGLYLIGVLSPEKLTDADGKDVDVDPVLDAYPEAVRSFVRTAVEGFGRHPRLLAWSVSISPDDVVWGDAGFQRFLQGAYPSIDALNASWDSGYEDFRDIPTARYRRPLPHRAGARSGPGDAGTDEESDAPGGVGRSSVDYAYYRQKTYADAMDVWAKALRDADGRRLIFAGGVNDYRSAISLPEDFDGIVMETTSARAEPDYATANVQAVDVARRANRMIAVQSLDVSSSPATSALRNWINLALLHGASGLQVESWSDLKDSDDLLAVVKAAADGVAAGGRFPTKPMARAAVLYEPYAGGAVRDDKPLYGYLEDLTEREPTDLFFSVRNGSRYGLMDVLSLDSLTKVDMKQYGALFAPMAFYLPEDAQAALNDFAVRGGLLMADAGVGMYQAQGEVGSVPEILQDTFGVRSPEPGEATPGTIQPEPSVTYADPDKPYEKPIGQPLDERMKTEKNLEDTVRQLYSMLTEPDVEKYLGKDFGGSESPGLRTRKVGKGIAVYAPVFLYQQWSPDADGYAEFHDRILGWRSDVRISEPDDLWPSVEASYAGDGSVTLVTPGAASAAVRFYNDPNEIFRIPNGATRVWEPSANEPAELLFPGDAMATAEPLPISVTPEDQGAEVVVRVLTLEPGKLVLAIDGAGSVATPSEGEVVVQGGSVTAAKVEISDGVFRIIPNTSYHVTIDDNGKSLGDTRLIPDPATRTLIIERQFRNSRVTIEADTTAAGGG